MSVVSSNLKNISAGDRGTLIFKLKRPVENYRKFQTLIYFALYRLREK